MPAPIRRELGVLERGWPWLAGAVAASGALTALALFAASGRLESRVTDRVLRGYTPVGLFLGVAAVVLAGLSTAYSLRKRPLQERLSTGRGPMTLWLWLHVAAGLVALVAAILHAGPGLISAQLSTGKVLAGIFVVLALSGVVWRLVYQVAPARFAALLGNYSERASELRAEALLVEIDKASAGRSPELHTLSRWLLETERSADEVTQAGAALAAPERAALATIDELAAGRRRALARMAEQGRATRRLQALRLIHVPLTLLLVPALLVHVAGALDLPVAATGTGDLPLQSLAGLRGARDCAACHRAAVEQWSGSMHAHALTSPVTIAQNNQLLATDPAYAGSPDPRRFCVNCHGPASVAATGRARLPLRRGGYDPGFLDEGVGCVACHQWRGTESPGSAGLSRFQAGLRPGSTYFGPLEDPVGNAFHRSAPASIFKRDGALCANCHDVLHDTNGDGKIAKGVDLVLQTTATEYAEYAARGGRPTCVGCHMPVMRGVTRAAERATLMLEQDTDAPPREVHDHSFVGVDYPIDEVARRDPQRAAREALLRSAARLDLGSAAIVNGELTFTASITSVGVGHDLPSGFAFARQLWLEVRVTSESGVPIFSSGILGRPSDDLCDAGTLDEVDNPARPFVVGCKASDRQLVSFQQKLVDRVTVARDAAGNPKLDARGQTTAAAAPGAREAWLQHLTAGAVPRVRPEGGAVLSPIAPDETRKFGYRVPLGGARRPTVTVRLLFRSLAPYMLRALAKGQGPGETPLGPLVENLQVVEMAAKAITVVGR